MAARGLRRALSTARPIAAPRAAPRAAARPRASFLSTTPAKASPAPQVADVTVHITFVDHEGSRAVVPGRVGMTVSEVAELHGIDIGRRPSRASSSESIVMCGPRTYLGKGLH